MAVQTCVQECSLVRKHMHAQCVSLTRPPLTITIVNTTLPFPRATRTKYTKRHVAKEGDEQEEEERTGELNKGEMTAQTTTRATETYSKTAARVRMLQGLIPTARPVCENRNIDA